jgi:3-oxoacyl-[acyl-carrier-protein] synthase-3
MQACMLLDCLHDKKVILINADVLSRRVSHHDRNSHPLIGDGAAITVLESSSNQSNILGELLMDGKNGDALRIPAGGFRLPSSSLTGEMVTDDMGNRRSLDHLHMQGDRVYSFVMSEVPHLIRNVLTRSGLEPQEISHFLMHQPNSFMLNRLAGMLEVGDEKIPSDLVRRFGNSSGASIPLLIATSLQHVFIHETRKVCMAGFGAGLAWGALVMDLGQLDFVEWIDYEN